MIEEYKLFILVSMLQQRLYKINTLHWSSLIWTWPSTSTDLQVCLNGLREQLQGSIRHV